MKQYAVEVPPSVLDIIDELTLRIALDSVANAVAWEGRLREAMRRTGDMPHGYPVDEDVTADLKHEVRKVVFERTYLIFYRVHDDRETVEILNVRHGARLRKPGEA